jgi:hypothetical protein
MNHWNSETRIRPKPRDDGPAGRREDHDRLLSEGLEGEPHTYRCSTSGTGEMAMAEILTKGYFYFSHSSLTALKIAK